MKLDHALSEFLASPVMIVIGTADGRLKPAIGRGLAARLDSEAGAVELVFCERQWSLTAANLRANGAVAVTFSRPSDYVSYQLKGRAILREATAEDLALCGRYRRDIQQAVGALGVASKMMAQWLVGEQLVVARIAVEAIFVQTPGPKAGALLRSEQ
jgi:predicted pyridoxine 5'-phosphate oxidase superfamily flavin-nucleotide-binding protein